MNVFVSLMLLDYNLLFRYTLVQVSYLLVTFFSAGIIQVVLFTKHLLVVESSTELFGLIYNQ